MVADIARFDGEFIVWSYTIGHGRLLLRRTKSIVHATRVDILFKNVALICLPMSFEDIRIEEVTFEEAKHFRIDTRWRNMKNRKFFRVSGENWQGYIVASTVVWHEDYHEYDAPSALLE